MTAKHRTFTGYVDWGIFVFFILLFVYILDENSAVETNCVISGYVGNETFHHKGEVKTIPMLEWEKRRYQPGHLLIVCENRGFININRKYTIRGYYVPNSKVSALRNRRVGNRIS